MDKGDRGDPLRNRYVNVDDFREEDDFLTIQRASAYAKRHSISTLVFAARTYHFRKTKRIHTKSIAHDDGCGDICEKEVHIFFENISELVLLGQCSKNGEILTVFEGINPMAMQVHMPSILWVTNAEKIRIQNIRFRRNIACNYSGIITNISENNVYIELLQDNVDNETLAAYCMNVLDLPSGRLCRPSLTNGFEHHNCWKRIRHGQYVISDKNIAEKCNIGEGLSFHQAGLTDFLLYFGCCKSLEFENIWIENSNGFGILTECCQDVQAKHLIMKPVENNFFMGPRDGWKIYRCTGSILLDRCIIEGVRMDGQNIHHNFFIPVRRTASNRMILKCKYAPLPLINGSIFVFYGKFGKQMYIIRDYHIESERFEKNPPVTTYGAAEEVKNVLNRWTYYEITVDDNFRFSSIESVGFGEALCWLPTKYYCKNSCFKNIAGAAHMIRGRNAEIDHCTYENIMNAGIMIGPEWDTHCEGGFGTNIFIHDNRFENCGFAYRYGDKGKAAISLCAQGFDASVISDVKIADNTICKSEIGIEVRTARKVMISKNLFENIENPILCNKKTVKQIWINGNKMA
jgi:hypothetical protein